MGRKHQKKLMVFLLANLLSIGLITLGCGFGQVLVPTLTPSPTPTSTLTPTPAPTSTPTLLPVSARGWESATLSSVCLEIQQTFTNVQGDFSVPIEITASRLLKRMGIQPMSPGEACDATLTINITARARQGNYDNSGKCYSSSSITSQAILTAQGYPTLEAEAFSENAGIPVFLEHCAKEPAGAPFYETFSRALMDSLLKIWGKPALLAGLADQDVEVRIGAVQAVTSPEARAAGLETSDMVSLLIPAIENDYQATDCLDPGASGPYAITALRALADEEKDLLPTVVPVMEEALLPISCKTYPALDALHNFGPAAIETVPTLIQLLRSYLRPNIDENYARSVSAALVEITGEDFGIDADAWQQWWDSQE